MNHDGKATNFFHPNCVHLNITVFVFVYYAEYDYFVQIKLFGDVFSFVLRSTIATFSCLFEEKNNNSMHIPPVPVLHITNYQFF